MAIRPKTLISCFLLLALLGLVYTFWSVVSAEAIPVISGPHGASTPYAASTARVADQLATPLPPEPDHSGLVDHCEDHPDTGRVAVTLLTGASEGLDKLSTQLVTSLRCVREPLLFSDLQQKLGRHQIHDVLADVSPETMDRNQDFYIYRMQHELAATGRETELRSLIDLVKDRRAPEEHVAWRVEEYKILHAVELAWRFQPNKDWYCFISVDTYLSWPNLLTFLQAHDPSESWYFGQPVPINGPSSLLRGDAAFCLSSRVVKAWNAPPAGLVSKWDNRIEKNRSLGNVLAAALNEELHIQITDATPMLQLEKPVMVAFGEMNWCKPIVTLQDLDSRQLDQAYKTETSMRGAPLLFKDFHAATFQSGYPFKRDDWDNGAGDAKYAIKVVQNDLEKAQGQWEPKDLVDPHQNFMACEFACVQNEACFQFMFVTATDSTTSDTATTICHLSEVFRLGDSREPQTPSDEQRVTRVCTSGWRSDRISRWIAEHQICS